MFGHEHALPRKPETRIWRYLLSTFAHFFSPPNLRQQERRRQLAFEAMEYKRIQFTLMQRVGDLSEVYSEDSREFSQEITSHLRRLYRCHTTQHHLRSYRRRAR